VVAEEDEMMAELEKKRIRSARSATAVTVRPLHPPSALQVDLDKRRPPWDSGVNIAHVSQPVARRMANILSQNVKSVPMQQTNVTSRTVTQHFIVVHPFRR
jgi:hypothetical protein